MANNKRHNKSDKRQTAVAQGEKTVSDSETQPEFTSMDIHKSKI